MLTIFGADGATRYPLELIDYCVTHVFDGRDTLSFDIDTILNEYKQLSEEVRISTGSNIFVVKSLDESGDTCTVDCQLDLDEWRERFYPAYKETERTLQEALDAIKPAGWTVAGAGAITIRRTLEGEYLTDYDLLFKAADTYGVTYQFDTLNRIVNVIVPDNYTASGAYLMEELNLKRVSFSGMSKDLVTRLYCYGKDGMTFADINDGKEYVENHDYTDKVISAVWKDDRYTVPENMLADARKKLETMSRPSRSYECDVIDLAALNPDYGFLTAWMYQVVTLIDKRRGTRIDHQVVEYKEYPLSPENNVITLATAAPKIESSIKQVQSSVEEVRAEAASGYAAAVDKATGIITGANGGYVVTRLNSEGQPIEILIMDSLDMNAAHKAWRWNVGGFGYSQNGINGPFETAITMDGAIVANFITAGTMSANLIRSGVIISQDGNSKIDLDSGNSELNGTFTSEGGEYKIKFWAGMLQLYKNNTETIELYSVGNEGEHYGIIRILDAGQNVLTSIVGGTISTWNINIRTSDTEDHRVLTGSDGLTKLWVDMINGYETEWLWDEDMQRYVLTAK